jgi:DNA-binding MarR family transcriptional regulator
MNSVHIRPMNKVQPQISDRFDAKSCPNCADRRARFLESGLSERSAGAAVDIDDTMVRLRQSLARREILRHAIADLGLDADIHHLMVAHAIHMGWHQHGEVTVGLVAETLGIDPSRASRLVAEAVDEGIARRVASQADARRICLELTDKAHAMQDAIHSYKALMFSEALKGWDEEELVAFARLFEKFSNWVADTGPGDARESRVDAIRKRLDAALKTSD